jgi:ribosome-associated translation inhibitor RaiA
MLIQVNTDNHIQGNERLTKYVQAVVQDTLSRFAEKITRVEVHLHDTNGAKGGDNDKRCAIEVRPAGFDPVNTTHHAADIDEAIDGAVEKMKTLLDRQFDKLTQTKGRVSHAGPQE